MHTDHGAVPIERIKVGDKIWARNERTGATELRRVTHIAPQHFDRLMELRIAGEKSALHPTPTHPFWARRKAGEPAHWIDASDLAAGMQLLAQDGRWLTIESVAALDKPAVVYNFTVEEDHDYFVGYPQVTEELVNGQAVRTYTYGLERISELQKVNSALTASFYQHYGGDCGARVSVWPVFTVPMLQRSCGRSPCQSEASWDGSLTTQSA